jgi:hypothetical protein
VIARLLPELQPLDQFAVDAAEAAVAEACSHWRTMHMQLVVCEQDKASRPRGRIFSPEHFTKARGQRESSGHAQADQHQAVMAAGCEAADVGKIQVLSDEESAAVLRRLPHVRIILAGDALQAHVVHVMAE